MASRVNVQVGFSVDKSGLSQMQSLFQQIANKAKEPGQQLNQGLQQAATTANTLDSILEKTFNTDLGTLNVTKFNQELSKSGLTLKQVQADLSKAGSQGSVAYNRLAQSILGTNIQLKESNKLLDSMATTMANTVKWGITSSIFNTITQSISKAVTYAKQLDTSLNDIRIVTDKSADSMAEFAEQANAAAKEMGASTLDYTNAALIYYQQGLSDEETKARAETTVKAANVTGQTGQEVSEQLTAVWNGYKVTAEETELYVDKLAAVAATTAADLEELSVGMSKVAAAANAMGVNFDDLNAQIATIVSVTRQAPESVGTALKTIYARLGDLKVDGVDEFGVKLGEVSAQMETMGIQILDQNGDLRDMSSVMAEVAEKWDTWTRAQQQAAAIAMAGKRQYNNLVALFENWDMYSEALETSTEAMGTLQHQQDIYMESTAGKLKVLKATWQDFYGDLIDKDELDTGIEGLTNLVQVFDNFIESFGGGIKSITAFGIIVANIFNKQIANAITEASHRQQIFQQNLELAQASNQIRQQGAINAGDDNRATAIAENTRVQIEYSKRIYDARVGLNQEQANTLINYQKELGALQEEITYTENLVKTTELKHLTDVEISDLLTVEEEKLQEINAEYGDIEISARNALDTAEMTLKNIKQQLSSNEKLENIKGNIVLESKALSSAEQIQIKNILSEVNSMEDLINRREEILLIFNKNVNAQKTNLEAIQEEEAAVDRVRQSREKIANLKQQSNNIKQQADDMLDFANKAKFTTQSIIGVTSALGTMAMAWSSVKSLMRTWKDDSASFGDKLTQTFMTLGMTLPMVISSFTKLNSVLGITKAFSVLFSTNKAKELLIQQASNTQQEIENRLLQKYANLKGITVGEIKASTKAKIAEMAATKAAEGATDGMTSAQIRLNAAMAANPIGLILTLLAALVAALALVHSHYEKMIQEIKDEAEAAKQEASNKKAEVDSNKELIDQFFKLNSQYEAGAVAKEELWEVTSKLIGTYDLEGSRLDMLNGKYDAIINKIREKRKEEQQELLNADKDSINKQMKALATDLEDNEVINYQNGQGYMYLDTFWSMTPEEQLEYNKIADKAIEIFGKENLEWDEAVFEDALGDISVGKTFTGVSFDDTQAGFDDFLKKYIEWGEAVKNQFGEDSSSYLEIQANIEKIQQSDTFKSIRESQKNTLDNILTGANFELAFTQEDFDAEIENLQSNLQWALTEGLIPPDTDINIAIANYIGKLNNSFAKNFLSHQALIEEYGEDNPFVKYFESLKLDEDVKIKVMDYFDFNMDPNKVQEGKDLLQDYIKLVQTDLSTVNAIPVSFQDQINDNILKGKDISKDDWESIIASAPGAEQILGDKDSFNNRSIGERIALMQQLNELTRENNLLNIEQYDENKKSSENALKDLDRQYEEVRKEYEKVYSKKGEDLLSDERREELEKELNDLQSQLIDITNKKYEIQLSLDMDEATDNIVQSIVGDLMTSADQLKAATEAIGDNWKVAAEDVATFAAAFPELMEGADRLEDGSLQLEKDIVNVALEGAQERIKANKEVAIAAAEDKIQQLKLEIELKEKQKAILQEALNGEKTKAETTVALQDAVLEYQQNLEDSKLISQADALNKAQIQEQTAVSGMINILGGLNDAINTIHNNFANMLVKDANMESLNAVAGSMSNVSAQTVDRSKIDDSFSTADIDAMIEAVAQLDSEISADKVQLAEYEGFISETMNSIAEADKAANRVKSGKAGKEPKGGGGGGKDKKKKDEKDYEKEFDRYWEIKKAIDGVDHALNRLEKDKKNLYGYQLIDALKYENELLEKQKGYYEQMLALQEQEAAELRGQLGTMGVVFDAGGAIVNYAEATAKALAAYNAAIQQYNAGLIDETTLGVAEKAFENFKNLLSRYDTLYYKEMQDTKDKLDDIRRKELENNLKAWEVEIQLKLDLKELKRGWNDFLKEINEDFQQVYQDLRVEAKRLMDDAKTYIGSDGSIATIINAIHDVTHEIDVMRGGGESSMFESISQAQEKLKELNDQLQDAARGLHDLWKEAWENYLNGIEQVSDKLEDLMDQFERINDELEFQGELIELIYGEEAYELLDTLYKGQEKSLENQTISLKTQVDMWRELFEATGATMDNQENWTQDQREYYDRWMEAQADLNDLVLDYIKLLKNDYLNTIKAVLKELEHTITGSSLDRVQTQWERISAYADKYLDDIEGAYEIQKLANKIDESINNMDDLKYQQKLKAFRDEEIKYLREKEHLTQYDLNAAEARYQIMLKEMALEDAQNNKTSMKLVRNEQGNWAYQYVADEDEMMNKRQELLDAFNQLYQLASDAVEANLEAGQELFETYKEKQEEIITDENLNEEERRLYLAELDEWYFQQYALLAEENQLYRNDLTEAGAALLLEVYNQDQEAFNTMTDKEQELITTLKDHGISEYGELRDVIKENYDGIKDKSRDVLAEIRVDWDSLAQGIIDLWNKDDGTSVKGAVTIAYKAIEKANEEYKLKVDWMATAVERNFGPEGITGAINNTANATDRLREKTYQLVSDGVSYLAVLKQAVDMIAAAWQSVQQEIMNAIGLLEQYISMIAGWNAAVEDYNARAAAGQHAADAATGGSSGGGGGGSPTSPSNSGDNQYWTQMDRIKYHQYEGNEGISGNREQMARIYHMASTYATGGYTGSWNNGSLDGKIAVLHQKELVLNEDDTSNFLQGINTIRDLSSLNGSISNAIMSSIAGMVASIVSPKANTGTGTINNTSTTQGDNVFNITAEFPNANDVNEIREAIMSLPNLASQYIARS